MENKKIKVVWVCHLSNEEIRKELKFRDSSSNRGRKDYSKWNTNAIYEFKKFNDVELHVISPHIGISDKVQEFTKDGIYYHFFRSEDDNLVFRIKRRLFKGKYETPEYKTNTKIILSIVNRIKPDLIHLIGAENPYYSISALSMPKDTPLVVALQTLMIDPDFFKNYPISKKNYEYKSGIERKILERTEYISCRSKKFIEILKKEISPNTTILDLPLVVGETINMHAAIKEYSFVYFAANISKAADYAIEAFAIVNKKHPETTMRVVGGYALEFKKQLDDRLTELKIADKVTFSGSLPTHDDVINEIRKAKFAVLPLKIDLISGTVREAMANGLPTVTTITPATPLLNEKRESVMLSDKGNFEAMANNMCCLYENDEIAKKMQANAYETVKEKYDNETIAQLWRDAYHAVLKKEEYGTPIPDTISR